MAPDRVRIGFTRGDVVVVTGAASGAAKQAFGRGTR
jgi:hypothetical protein